MRKQKSLARALPSRRSLDPFVKRGRLFPKLAPGLMLAGEQDRLSRAGGVTDCIGNTDPNAVAP